MTSDDIWPSDPAAVTALVALVVDDIHGLNAAARDALLDRFLSTAWPSPRCQRQ